MFKVWSGNSRCWVGGLVTVFQDGTIGRYSPNTKCFDILGKEEFEIIKYTGLKDSKGIEIYEGDVIKTNEIIWLVEPIGEEERDGDQYGLCVSDKGCGENYFIDSSILKGDVIGNIYEEPGILD